MAPQPFNAEQVPNLRISEKDKSSKINPFKKRKPRITDYDVDWKNS
jgi:hypothetical protein